MTVSVVVAPLRRPEVHKAVLWLENNKQLFREEVFEPAVMQVSDRAFSGAGGGVWGLRCY